VGHRYYGKLAADTESRSGCRRHVADELDKQTKSISVAAVYDALPIEEKQIICAEVDRLLHEQAESEISNSPVNLPVPAVGQSVLNLTTDAESA
jgi:hypothetical protein